MTIYRDIIKRIDKVHLLRRVWLQSNRDRTGLYFGQFPILDYIHTHPGCTQSELSEVLAVTPASIALSTKRLQKSGLLEKIVDENNLRRNKLSLTHEGIRAIEKYRAIFLQFEQEAFAGFREEELQNFKEYLDRMTMNITGEDTNDVNFNVIGKLIKQIDCRKRT